MDCAPRSTGRECQLRAVKATTILYYSLSRRRVRLKIHIKPFSSYSSRAQQLIGKRKNTQTQTYRHTRARTFSLASNAEEEVRRIKVRPIGLMAYGSLFSFQIFWRDWHCARTRRARTCDTRLSFGNLS